MTPDLPDIIDLSDENTPSAEIADAYATHFIATAQICAAEVQAGGEPIAAT